MRLIIQQSANISKFQSIPVADEILNLNIATDRKLVELILTNPCQYIDKDFPGNVDLFGKINSFN